MQKSEMTIGGVHAVEYPAGEAQAGRYTGSPVVKAEVLATGLERRSRFGGGNARNDGVRCRLLARVRTIEGTGRNSGAFCERESGFEFEVSSRDVHRVWNGWDGNRGHDDDAMQVKREARYGVQDELRVIFERLGAPKVELAGDGAVFAAADLLRWLKRIDPASIGEQAIGLFEEAFERNGGTFEAGTDGATLDDLRGEVGLARSEALREVAEGVAVTDVEIGGED